MKAKELKDSNVICITDQNGKSERSKRRLSAEGFSVKGKGRLIDYVI